jgi:lysophospholipase L1-like esterase
MSSASRALGRVRVASLVACLALAPLTAPVVVMGMAQAATAPVARFTWSVQRLTTDSDGVVKETLDTSQNNHLTLNGCSSSGGSSLIANYTWMVNGAVVRPLPVPLPGFARCIAKVTTPGLSGNWTVTLTVRTRDGQTAQTTQPVNFSDRLIASLGDSAASGEGNPDKFGQYNLLGQPFFPARWASHRCDRSGRAASARAAWRIEQADPHTSVTFWHLACSGARIPHLLSERYEGKNPVRGSTLPPQIQELNDLANIAGRPVDALLLTVGANDIGFAHIVKHCYRDGPGCIRYWSDELRKRKAFEEVLPKGYEKLGERLRDSRVRLRTGQVVPLVAPDRVFLTEYYDPTHDPREFGGACSDPLTPGPSVRKFGYEKVVVPLNKAARAAANNANWRFVDGIERDFHDHGICAPRTWIRQTYESLVFQGNVDGAWHPNEAGQQAIANHLVRALSTIHRS